MCKVRSCQRLLVAGGFAKGRRCRHQGVTLLEVLFAIGIVAVGLLGVMIIIPLAGMRTEQGTIADGADRLGRNAIRAFDVYQMRRPDSWAVDLFGGSYLPYLNPHRAWSASNSYSIGAYCLPTTPNNRCYVATVAGASGALEPVWPSAVGGTVTDNSVTWLCLPMVGICIDPLYVGANVGTAGIQRFPYFPTQPGPPAKVPWMMRVTLRTSPDATTGSPPTVPPMSVSQAGQIFLGGDDLVFSLVTDRTLPPQQKFDFGGAGTPEALKRQWEGKFSWLATLVPKPGYTSDTYLLSIVVFHRRDPLVDAERMVDVTTFHSNGFNGGDVTLSALPAAKDDLKMKEGEWLMLAGMNAGTGQHFRWYRIQTADAAPYEDTSVTPPVWRRELTLFGQDWPVTQLTVHKAVWIPGIVAVYEKTIRLETSSLWTNL